MTVTWAEAKKNEALFEALASQVKAIYVGNLPESADEAKLRGIFSAYGQVGWSESPIAAVVDALVSDLNYWCAWVQIVTVTLMKDKLDPAKIRNYCFIKFEERASALKAVEETDVKHEMDGNELMVSNSLELEEATRLLGYYPHRDIAPADQSEHRTTRSDPGQIPC